MYIIGGSQKNRRLFTPKGMTTRPTSSRLRETLFNICQHKIQGAYFLDLFAGSGAIGLEGLSRGAAFCTFIDNSKESINIIRKNIEELSFQKNTLVSQGDVFSMLQLLERKKMSFDIIYVDPPYEKKERFEGEIFSYSEKIIHQIDNHPHILKENGFLFVEDVIDLSTIELTNLSLVSSRKAGRANLTQFQR